MEKAKKLKYKLITAIHDEVIVAPNQSATKLRHNLENAKLYTTESTQVCSAARALLQKRAHDWGNICQFKGAGDYWAAD